MKKKKNKISRYNIMIVIMFCIFGAIILRLAYLQLYKGEDYSDKANTKSRRLMAEKAPRGRILDTNGNILATNKQSYTLTYMSSEEGEKEFFSTINKVFDLLEKNDENIVDEFMLKIDENNKLYLEYKSNNEDTIKALDLRFKKDRGFDDPIRKKLYSGKTASDLTDEEQAKIDEELLKITPDEIFNKLLKSYDMYELLEPTTDEEKSMYKDMDAEELRDKLLEKYSLEEIRKYMVVKDAIKMQSYKGYKPVTIASNISKDSAFEFYQKLNDMPGIDVSLEPTRYYPYKDLASSVIGYVGSIDGGSAQRYEEKGYDVSTDQVGKSGIEYALEDMLKGTKGGTTVKVNSKGRKTEELFRLETFPGNDVTLTIDKNVQYAAEEAMKDTIQRLQTGQAGDGEVHPNATRGAAVAIDVNTGKVISMVSYPNVDLNIFTTPGAMTPEVNKQIFNPDYESFGSKLIANRKLNKTVDELFPKNSSGYREDKYDLYPKATFNYATMGLIPPGSTFKPLTSVAALEEGVVTPTETIYDRGKYNVHPELFGKAFGPECEVYSLRHETHGPTDVTKALQVSCNYFYYETAYRMYMKNSQEQSKIEALDSIAKYAWKAGLGTDPNSDNNRGTGIEISENVNGETYSFETFKENIIRYAGFELSSYLEGGSYKGMFSFVPFDYSKSDSDSVELANAKKELKAKITERLKLVGTDEEKAGYDEYIKQIKPLIKKVADNSPKYKENLKSANKDVDDQISLIAKAIAQFVVHDKANEITSPAQLVYASIGQGMNSYTPVQLANYIATIVNGGTRYKVTLVDKITTSDGEVVKTFQPEVLDEMNLKESTVEAVKQGMYKVNHESGGTGSSIFRNFPIQTGGKTGTATLSGNQKEYGREAYGVYVSFAPLDKPEIAVVTVVYDGGHGFTSAPVARAIYEAYFKDRILELNPNYTSDTWKYVVGENASPDNSDDSIPTEDEEVNENPIAPIGVDENRKVNSLPQTTVID